MPGARSTPDDTSIPNGRTRATASATLSGVRPPASSMRARRRKLAPRRPVDRSVRCRRAAPDRATSSSSVDAAPATPRAIAVDRDRLDHRTRQRRRELGRLVAVQLHGAEPHQARDAVDVRRRLVRRTHRPASQTAAARATIARRGTDR